MGAAEAATAVGKAAVTGVAEADEMGDADGAEAALALRDDGLTRMDVTLS